MVIIAWLLLSASVDAFNYRHFAATVSESAPQPCGVEIPCAFNIAIVPDSYAIVGTVFFDRVVWVPEMLSFVLWRSDGTGHGEVYLVFDGQAFRWRWTVDLFNNHAYGWATEIAP